MAPLDAIQTPAGSTASTPREAFYGFLSIGLFFALSWLWFKRLEPRWRETPYLDPEREESTGDVLVRGRMRLRYLWLAGAMIAGGTLFSHVLGVRHDSLAGAVVFAVFWIPGFFLAWGAIFGRYSGD